MSRNQHNERASQVRQPPVGDYRRNDESWVEVSSQPSSSSLSSIGEEIVTTGLRVGNSLTAARRRRSLNPQPIPRSYHTDQTVIQGGTSSQEEYDETESEEDRLMTSSSENVRPPVQQGYRSTQRQFESDDSEEGEEEDDDDDDHATALGGRVPDDVFRPHPNAFSRPPSFANRSSSASAVPPHHPHSRVRPGLAQRSQTRPSQHRGAPNFMSPTYQADNDEALRSSLTTLLSCAAAARALPKYKDSEQQGASGAGAGAGPAGVGPSNQPVELRLMPEADLPDPATDNRGLFPATAGQNKSPTRSRSTGSPSPTTAAGQERNKRRESTSQTRGSRATKKKKVSAMAAEDAGTTYISPTLMTWFVGAGVVVLVSVVGFGAGYVIGREVGRQEGISAAASSGSLNASSVVNDSASCGREVMRSSSGLKRLRWGTVVAPS